MSHERATPDDSTRELDRFTRRIDLVQFAQTWGYERRPLDSTPSTIVMSNTTPPGSPAIEAFRYVDRYPGPMPELKDAQVKLRLPVARTEELPLHKTVERADEIVVARGTNGRWLYSHVHNSNDKGTIVDFLARRVISLQDPAYLSRPVDVERSYSTLPNICKELRGFPSSNGHNGPTPIDPDRLHIARAIQAACHVERDDHLAQCRIDPTTYRDPKFQRAWRRDAEGSLLFPHRDEHGFTGYELKSRGMDSFSQHGKKAIWHSVPAPHERILVITETPLAAMSYHQLRPRAGVSKQEMRFASVGSGPMNTRQAELVEKALAQLPHNSMCIAAVGSHDRGNALTEQIAGLASRSAGLRFLRDPAQNALDWNQALQRNRVLNLRATWDRGR